MPTENPILFSAPMVRAILSGAKVVTRRVVKFPPAMAARGIRYDLLCYTSGGPRWREYEAQLAAKDPDAWSFDAWPPGLCVSCDDATCQRLPCPCGAAGDRLWVRESWCAADTMYYEHDQSPPRVVGYLADRSALSFEDAFDGRKPRVIPAFDREQWDWKMLRGRPSIHMPRWASRLSLDVVSVGVERLQDITDEDAVREGVTPLWLQDGEPGCWYTGDPSKGAKMHARTARGAFEKLWVAINGRESWESDPFVWRVEFARRP